MKTYPTFNFPFQDKGISTVTIISALAIAAIGAAATSFWIKRKQRNKENPTNKLGNLIQDVRQHIKQTAEGVVGTANSKHDVSKIKVAHAGTSAWKHQLEK